MRTQYATYPATCHFAQNPSRTGQCCATQSAATALPLYAPFLLLIRWVLGWAVNDAASLAPSDAAGGAPLSAPRVFRRRHQWLHDLRGCHLSRRLRRRQKSRARRAVPYYDDYIPFFTLLEDTKSKRGFNEKLTRLSVYCRIYLYGMRGYKRRPLSKATLLPDACHTAPMPVTAAINSGLWDAQALPDWSHSSTYP